MTIKQAEQSRKLWYALRRIVTLGGVIGYILFQTGIFNDAVTDATVKSTVYILGGWAVITLIRDQHKRATAKDNPNIGQLSRATAMNKSVPWIVVLVIAGAIYAGIANVFQHILVISSMMIGGNIFYGFEMKYDLILKRGKTKDEVKDDVRVVA